MALKRPLSLLHSLMGSICVHTQQIKKKSMYVEAGRGAACAEMHQGTLSINHPSQPPYQHPLLPAKPGTRRAQASSYCLQVSPKGRDLKNFYRCQEGQVPAQQSS